LVEKIKAKIPNATFTTDIIVGFPGETEEDFLETIDVVKKVRYDSAYTYIYSRRVGTPADKMEDQIAEEVKVERIGRLIEVVNEILEEQNEKLVGTIQKVLVEGTSKTNKDTLTGRTDGGKVVNFTGDSSLIGKMVNIKITEQRKWYLTGNIDILVLNASVQIRKRWDTITEDEFDTQMTVNFKSSVKLIQKYAPAMLENRWGRIVTIGSVQQKKPHKDMLIYAASKAAQMNMVQNLAKQFAPYGVTVNNIAPGVIATPRNDSALSDPEYKKQVMQGIPSERIGTPEDCAAQILLLCSEEGRYMTGEDIYIDGGMKL